MANAQGAFDFRAEFIQEIAEQHLAFEIRGVLTANDRILTLGTDTKVLNTSFLRNNTKNIAFPYNTYAKHWILGFVYSRAEAEESRVVTLDDRDTITCPYEDVEWFVQEKYRVAGLAPGSGNTTNIASIQTANVDDFRNGNGPFADLGEEYFREYWANFGATNGVKFYRTIAEFEQWKAEQAAGH